MVDKSFGYRILVVEDEPSLRELAKMRLERQGYEVLCAEDGFEGLACLRKSLPDMIISDLAMPNMSGFEFLSVIRRRFPNIPVIAISGRFRGLTIPDNVLADAFFSKTEYRPAQLFEKILTLLDELPNRPKVGRRHQAAVWVQNSKGTIAVTCSECLRTFPALNIKAGANEAECDFCSALIRFEIIGDDLSRLAS